MIKDYLDILNENTLSIFLYNSIFLSHTHKNKSGKITAYYHGSINFEDNRYKKGYVTFKLPTTIYKASSKLIKLCAIKNDLRDPYEYEDSCLAIDDINFEKIQLLYDILFYKVNQNNILLIEILVNIVNNEGYSAKLIKKILNINENKYYFNDTEIFIYSLSIQNKGHIEKLILFLNKIVNQDNIDKLTKIIKMKKIPIIIQKTNNISFLDNIKYNRQTGKFTNVSNNTSYEILGHYKSFLEILIEKKSRVKYDDIIKYVAKNNIGNNITDILTYKGNFIKLLRGNNILGKKEDFIDGKDGGYLLNIIDK